MIDERPERIELCGESESEPGNWVRGLLRWRQRKMPNEAGRSEMRHGAVHFLTSRVPLCRHIVIVMPRAGSHQNDVERGLRSESGMFAFSSKC